MSNLLIEKPPVLPVREVENSPTVDAKGPPSNATFLPRYWLMITCLLLSISGGIRYLREWQFRKIAQETTASPFPLSELPTVLGTWHSIGDAHLDPETIRLAGSSDHILRSYRDSETKETVSVLVVYGLAVSVFGHSPAVCYPASGYDVVGKSEDHDISLTGSATSVRYRSELFSKTVASVTESYEVFWCFWHSGLWLPDVQDRWKLFRTSPALFKIQIQCPVTGISSQRSSVESLLKELVREIDTRREKVAAAGAPAKGSKAVRTQP